MTKMAPPPKLPKQSEPNRTRDFDGFDKFDSGVKSAAASTFGRLIETDGHRRVVQRRATLCSFLFKNGKITPGLMTAFDQVVRAAAKVLGAATEDGQPSTAKLISRYDGMPSAACTAMAERIGGQPTWFSPRDSQLEASRLLKHIVTRLPPEMHPVFEECLREEIGAQLQKPLTLTHLGQQRGYLHKQAPAAGGIVVADMVAVVAHALREYLGQKEPDKVHPKPRRD